MDFRHLAYCLCLFVTALVGNYQHRTQGRRIPAYPCQILKRKR